MPPRPSAKLNVCGRERMSRKATVPSSNLSEGLHFRTWKLSLDVAMATVPPPQNTFFMISILSVLTCTWEQHFGELDPTGL